MIWYLGTWRLKIKIKWSPSWNSARKSDCGFWDVNFNEVSTYFKSCFLVHVTSNYIYLNFQETSGVTLFPKLLHVTVDEPNFNWKCYDYLPENHNEIHIKELNDIGSCGLHLIHGAFQTGNKNPEWTLIPSFARFIDYLKI